MKTPRTDFIASQCNSDSEQSDLSAYHIMMAHAYELERELTAEKEKVKRPRKTLEKCNAEFIAMKHLGDKDMDEAIADTRATLEATK